MVLRTILSYYDTSGWIQTFTYDSDLVLLLLSSWMLLGIEADTSVVQFVAGLMEQEVEFLNMVLQLLMQWHVHMSSVEVVSCVVGEAGILKLFHILSTHTGKCFLHGSG